MNKERIRKGITLGALLFVLFIPVYMVAAESLAVAVLDAVGAPGLDASLGGPIADKVVETMIPNRSLSMLDRSALEKILEEQQFTLSGFVSDTDAKKVGMLAGADAIVVLKFSKLGTTWFLSGRMIQVKTGIILAQASAEASGDPGVLLKLGANLGTALANRNSGTVSTKYDPFSNEAITFKIESSESKAVLDEAIGRFCEVHPNVNFETTFINWQIPDTYSDYLLSENGPDFIFTRSEIINKLWYEGSIKQIEGMVNTTAVEPLALATLSPKGLLIGVPYTMGNHLMLLYNKEFVSTAPKTFADVQKLQSSLKKQGVIPIQFPGRDVYWLHPWLAGNEVNFFDSNLKLQFDVSKVSKALTEYRDTVTTLSALTYDSEVIKSNFLIGKTAMIIDGDWNLQQYRIQLGDNLGVSALPMQGNKNLGPWVQTRAIALNQKLEGEKLKLALEFISYFIKPEVQAVVPIYETMLPVIIDPTIQRYIRLDPILNGVASAIKNGVPFPYHPNFGSYLAKSGAILNQFLDRGMTSISAARRLETLAKEQLQR